MSHSVQMPALGESVTEGTVTRWLKNVGDEVTEDEPLVEVSTDKVDTEVPAPYSGVLEKILVAEDETVEVGADLAIIGDGSAAGGGDAAEQPAQAEPREEQQAQEQQAQPAQEQQTQAAPREEQQAQPAAESVTGGSKAQGTPVTMPEMGESVTEGTVTRWLKDVGDHVAEDEPIVEIATDKVDAEVPSPVAGTLLSIVAGQDATVEVGSTLAIIGEAGASADTGRPATPGDATGPQQPRQPEQAQQPQQQPAPTHEQPPAPQPRPEPVQQQAPPAERAAAPAGPGSGPGGYITPVVRKLASDHGVDLSAVSGTGVGGRIRREDVLAAAQRRRSAEAPAASAPSQTQLTADVPTTVPVAAGGPSPARTPVSRPVDRQAAALAGTTQPTPRIRQSIARSVLHAVTTSAQATMVVEVDVSRVAALRDRARDGFEAREGARLTFLPFFVKATVEAAQSHPIINSSLSDDLMSITYHDSVHVGITVDTPNGQIVPVIHQADDLNVRGLARRIAELADRARSGDLGPDELSGATLTVSNSGSVGALVDTAIFVPPQSALVTIGAVVKRPVVVADSEGNDVIAVRSIAHLALSYDQRTIDGADAARYLSAVKHRIEVGDFDADVGV